MKCQLYQPPPNMHNSVLTINLCLSLFGIYVHLVDFFAVFLPGSHPHM